MNKFGGFVPIFLAERERVLNQQAQDEERNRQQQGIQQMFQMLGLQAPQGYIDPSQANTVAGVLESRKQTQEGRDWSTQREDELYKRDRTDRQQDIADEREYQRQVLAGEREYQADREQQKIDQEDAEVRQVMMAQGLKPRPGVKYTYDYARLMMDFDDHQKRMEESGTTVPEWTKRLRNMAGESLAEKLGIGDPRERYNALYEWDIAKDPVVAAMRERDPDGYDIFYTDYLQALMNAKDVADFADKHTTKKAPEPPAKPDPSDLKQAARIRGGAPGLSVNYSMPSPYYNTSLRPDFMKMIDQLNLKAR